MTARKLVVLADLSDAVRLQLEPVLSELGLTTLTARDDIDVLRLAGGKAPSLVLAKASHGEEICARLRHAESTRNLPIVLVGEENGRESRLAALRAGADEFFGEPLDPEDVRLRIHALLRRARGAANANGGARVSEKDSPIPPTRLENRRRLYQSTVAVVRNVLAELESKRSPDLDELHEPAAELVRSTEGSEAMIALALEAREPNDWAAHQVNVAVLGVAIARQLRLPQEELERYALLGLVHDLGMVKIPKSILDAPRRLTREEFQLVTDHPGHTREILRQAGPAYHEIADIAYQEHEREKGQGYPRGLHGDQIHELAKIVGVADVYEACTHARPYRKTFIPYEALQELIEMRGEYFHPRYIKALMSALTIYPIGSYIQLNTGEVGRVVATNRQNLMRPTVELLWNTRGERLDVPRTMELSESPFLFISKPLSEELLPRS